MGDWQSDKKLIAATLSSGAVASGDAANYTFANSVRMCLVSNNSAATRFLVRGNVDAAEAAVANYEEVIAPGQTIDLCRDGRRTIDDVSVFFDGAVAADEVQVFGLP